MKLNLIIFAIFLTILSGCNKSKEVNITGRISGNIPDKITYSVPVNGVSYFGFTESVVPDSLGNFHINLETGKAAFIIITVPGIDPKIILAEPGEDYTVIFNTEDNSESFKFFGANETGQVLYNNLPNPLFLQIEAMKFIKYPSREAMASLKTIRYPSQDSVLKLISNQKSFELSRFRELHDKKEISDNFFNLITEDRNCYFAGLTATVEFLNFCINLRSPDSMQRKSFPTEMKKIWETVYSEYPPDTKSLLSSHFWFDYATTYLNCKEFLSDSFKVEGRSALFEKGLIHTHSLNEAKKYLKGEALEYYEAAYIFFNASNKNYEEEFIEIYNQFNIDFPDSKFVKYLDTLITPITDFHKKSGSPHDANIRFVDNYEKLNSLSDAAKLFKGRKIFVDIWASWCSPCKTEFESKDKLLKLLGSRGIELLYISIDDDKRDTQWKEMIKYYDLQGYHIRANEQLALDLTRLFDQNGSISIPWHMLIDENGKIIIKRAKGASETEELDKEIIGLK